MYIGVTSPVVIDHPAARVEWERHAGIDELARVTEAADRLGYHHVTCSEHVAIPTPIAAERGGVYWDPLATFGYLAARTRRIRLNTRVLVLGYHHPLEIAKRYGTLDAISGGRLVLGFGVGSLEEEFNLLEASFTDRGARADEALLALRTGLSTPHPEFHGTFYEYADVEVRPHAVQSRVPFWIGGRTARSLRRAVTLGDGWLPFGLATGQIDDMLRATDLPDGFEVVLDAGRPLDPLGDRDATLRALDRRRAIGATVVSATFRSTGPDHYCDQLAALREFAGEAGATFESASSNTASDVEGNPDRA
ncbi:MAG: LLM class F420-dependent oxidoreductase [Rhodococcus sp. (in: high G+C Gram-positive bacteria)]|uniref:LLM class F420-dependent oxidoreductase n=1 Tax=Rhodococcus sp. TaxID=1831 RepID=UPI003BB50DFE